MKINRHMIKRAGCAFMCAAAMLAGLNMNAALTAYAEGAAVNIICSSDESTVSGVEFSVYKAAVKNSEGEFELTGVFEDYPVSLKKISDSAAMQDAANTLENYAVLDKLTPVGKGVTDDSGSVTIEGAESGLYLITGKRFIENGSWVIPSPMLVEFTDDDISGGSIDIHPKFSLTKLPQENPAEYGVKKEWDILEQFEYARPEAVKVEIYEDGELSETVTLDESNSWEYYWQGNSEHEWRVKEIEIAQDYTVVYRANETLYQIENTYSITEGGGDNNESKPESTPDTPSESKTDSTPDTGIGKDESSKTSTEESKTETSSTPDTPLPQTGSLWWPVPVMGGAGLILVAAGVRVSRKK